MDDGSGYELNDPKSEGYHDRMSDVWDNRDKFLVEQSEVRNMGGRRTSYRAIAYNNKSLVQIRDDTSKVLTFMDKREFRLFLKMLMRLDERL